MWHVLCHFIHFLFPHRVNWTAVVIKEIFFSPENVSRHDGIVWLWGDWQYTVTPIEQGHWRIAGDYWYVQSCYLKLRGWSPNLALTGWRHWCRNLISFLTEQKRQISVQNCDTPLKPYILSRETGVHESCRVCERPHRIQHDRKGWSCWSDHAREDGAYWADQRKHGNSARLLCRLKRVRGY